MPPRLRTSVLVVFVLIFLYFVFPFSSQRDTHVVDVLNPGTASGGVAKENHAYGSILHDDGDIPEAATQHIPKPVQTSVTPPVKPTAGTSVDIPKDAGAPTVVSQELFNKENDALGV